MHYGFRYVQRGNLQLIRCLSSVTMSSCEHFSWIRLGKTWNKYSSSFFHAKNLPISSEIAGYTNAGKTPTPAPSPLPTLSVNGCNTLGFRSPHWGMSRSQAGPYLQEETLGRWVKGFSVKVFTHPLKLWYKHPSKVRVQIAVPTLAWLHPLSMRFIFWINFTRSYGVNSHQQLGHSRCLLWRNTTTYFHSKGIQLLRLEVTLLRKLRSMRTGVSEICINGIVLMWTKMLRYLMRRTSWLPQ